MFPGKKGFDRLVYACKNVLNTPVTWLFCNAATTGKSFAQAYPVSGAYSDMNLLSTITRSAEPIFSNKIHVRAVPRTRLPGPDTTTITTLGHHPKRRQTGPRRLCHRDVRVAIPHPSAEPPRQGRGQYRPVPLAIPGPRGPRHAVTRKRVRDLVARLLHLALGAQRPHQRPRRHAVTHLVLAKRDVLFKGYDGR